MKNKNQEEEDIEFLFGEGMAEKTTGWLVATFFVGLGIILLFCLFVAWWSS